MKKEQMKQYLQRIEPFLKKNRILLLALFAGIMMLTFTVPSKEEASIPAEEEAAQIADNTFDLATFESQLQERLSKIEGVGQVQLTLSLKTTEEEVYAADIRQSKQSGEVSSYESTLAVMANGSYGQKPIPIKQVYPTFRGALVLCDGADSDVVKLAVTQAVSAVCGIGSDKVAVLKMQS